MKVLCLDIDGVLNHVDTEDRVGGFIGIDPQLVERFNRIIDAHPDVKIVISSTWRRTSMCGAYTDFPGLVEFLASRGLKGEIIDLTPIHFGYVTRGQEIKEWLEDHPEVTSFVVLDDSTDGMEGYVSTLEDGTEIVHSIDLRPFHVVTHWDTDPNTPTDVSGGLQDRHIEAAIRVLNGETL